MQHGLDLATAAETYTILTVGEGLVTAIPGAARLDGRRSDHDARGRRIAPRRRSGRRSCSREPRPLAVAAGVLTLLALIPGLPKFAFLSVAARARRAPRTRCATPPRTRGRRAADAAAVADAPERVTGGRSARRRSRLRARRPRGREAGRHAADARARHPPADRDRDRRRRARRCASPTTCSSARAATASSSRASRSRAASSTPSGCWPSTRARRRGRSRACRRRSRRSACRRSGSPATSATRATAAGYTVVDATTALSTHLSETIRTFLPDLLSRQQVKEMVDAVAQTSPKLVEELVPEDGLARRDPARPAAAAARARAGARSGRRSSRRSPTPRR